MLKETETLKKQMEVIESVPPPEGMTRLPCVAYKVLSFLSSFRKKTKILKKHIHLVFPLMPFFWRME